MPLKGTIMPLEGHFLLCVLMCDFIIFLLWLQLLPTFLLYSIALYEYHLFVHMVATQLI